jgi:LmbE family N-acetylglucosaminyl deacetylase
MALTMTDDAAARLLDRLTGATVLLLVPHPDDESLALAGLIQHALERQARVMLVQVTAGDNNPWPQRWLERRLRIGASERRRWGSRRNAEMLAAIKCFGLDRGSRRALDWPDMGVTARLRAQPEASIAAIADIVRELAPEFLVMPTLSDSHPDHGACHVLARLALAHVSQPPVCLGYHVHGRAPDMAQTIALPLDASMRETKRRAILAHHTQVALARRRLLAHAGPAEVLFALPDAAGDDADACVPKAAILPWRPTTALRRGLRLTLAHPDGVSVWRWPDAPLQQRARDPLRLALPTDVRRGPVFVKLEWCGRSPWIFDHWGWCDLTAGASRAKLSTNRGGGDNRHGH